MIYKLIKKMDLNYEEILEKVKEIAIKAGETIKEAFNSREIINTSIEIKDSNTTDLVTEVDKNVEKIVFNSLKELYPNFKLIGEETVSSSESKKIILTDSPTWIIDPVDGTTNFVHGFPFVCISIGLVVKKEPVLGIIFNPILNEMYWGIKNKGSYLNGKKLPLIKNTPIISLKKSLFVIEYGVFFGQEKLNKIIENVSQMLSIPVHGMRCLGSTALDIMQVAKGGADFFFSVGFHAWDVAAAKVILSESGGVMVGYRRPKDLTENILIADEPYDICQRKVLCMRGTIEGKEFQSKILKEIRDKLIDIDFESD